MPSPAAREVANTNGRNSTGFLNATASVTIPAGAVQVGDLLIVTITADSGDADNWGELSGSGWTRFLYVDRGAGQPKLKGWWKLNTTTASQTYSATMTGAAWAQVSYWQAWQVGTFNPDFPIGGAIGHVGSKAPPYPSTASTLYAVPEGTGDRVLQTVFSLFNNPTNSPSWINRPSPWNQTCNRESGGNYNSQYGAWRYITPGGSNIAVPAVDFPVNDTVARPYVNATFYINPTPPIVDIRSGTGWAGGLGLSGRADGAKTGAGAPAARLGFGASGSGSKSTQSHGDARLGLSGGAAGAKSTAGTAQSAAIGLSARAAGSKLAKGTNQAAGIGLGAYGTTPPPIPVFTGRPLPEDPLPMADTRYLVQNILTGDWLHTDLPLSEDQVTITLSGPCAITGKITPEMADLKTADGKPLLRSWGHVVYLEMDGDIRAAGLITEDSYDDQTQLLACRGVSAYPKLIPYQGNYSRYFADPLDVFTDMWAYVQSFQNGNLGVTVERAGGRPPALLGVDITAPSEGVAGVPLAPRPTPEPGQPQDPDPPIIPVRYANTVPAVYARLTAMGYRARGGLLDPTKPAGQDNPVIPADTLYVRAGDLERAYEEHFATSPGPVTLTAPPDVTAKVLVQPYKVDWWDVKTCGQIGDDMVKACPADYVEQYRWNTPRTFVYQTVLTAYPRIGRRRDDLRFVTGENIIDDPDLNFDEEGYATAVVGIGAGEGSASLRETAEVVVPGRTRKVHVYRNSNITDRGELRRIVAQQLVQRSSFEGQEIARIVITASHVNAPFGAYNVGDDIYAQVQVPHWGWLRQWCRITSMTLAREADMVELNLRRSDSFMYGREVEAS